MSSFSQSPVYNLKAVLKETNLTADVLRAWERRYKLPKPQRTPGGHRLYSEYDIETVKWLRARQAEGLSISRAVELWKDMIDAGRDPLAAFLPPATRSMTNPALTGDATIEALLRSWLDAVMAFDESKAEQVLAQAFAMYPVETVCVAILQHGLSSIGNDWYHGKASVQQEHFASALAVRRVEALIIATPRPTRNQTVLVGCPPEEWHTFSTLLLTLFLRRKGVDVVYLGADIPIDLLEETTAAIRPNLVILSAQQLTSAATLLSIAQVLQRKGIPLAYGGLIFNRVPQLRARIPAFFLGESLESSIQIIEHLMLSPTSLPNGIEANLALMGLAQLYRDKRPIIEVRLYERLQKEGFQMEYVRNANSFFGNELAAALELGDPALLEADLEWVKQLLTGRRIKAEQLQPYLAAYSHILYEEMGATAAPIIDWISAYLNSN